MGIPGRWAATATCCATTKRTIISLELGGSPASPDNLWPEPHQVVGGWGSDVKDQLENRLHLMVCSGRISLASAQQMIATNWIDAYRRYISPIPVRRASRHRR